MKEITEIKEAIIQVKDGVLQVIHGKNLNQKNPDYHNRVSIGYQSGGNEILIKGHKLKEKYFQSSCTEEDEKFEYYCENLIGFKERVETKKTLKFSWRKFKKILIKEIRYVDHEWYTDRTRTYIFKEELWDVREYKANNWVFTEMK
jgi:hypothetical protein